MTEPRRHLLLVGLPGAGKTTVGSLLAAALDTHASDIDRVIERSAGLSIPDVFSLLGEREFRARERQAVLEALLLPPHVIAAGGGWAAEPGNLDGVAGRALVVYLRVPAEVAAERLDGSADRPLLDPADPAATLRRLLAEREPFYLAADAVVNASMEPALVAGAIEAIARDRGGW